MKSNIQYVINDKGSATSVILPLNEWKEINNKYEKLLRKMEILTGIKEAIHEVKKAKQNGKKLQTLSSFLNEI